MRRHLSTRARIVVGFLLWGAGTVAWASLPHGTVTAGAAGLAALFAALHSRRVRQAVAVGVGVAVALALVGWTLATTGAWAWVLAAGAVYVVLRLLRRLVAAD